MGLEATCKAEYNGRLSKGTALLETDHVLFRGDYRVKVLFKEIVSLAVEDGRLDVVTDTAELHLHLGAAAQRWKDKIAHPPSLLSKLGVKPGVNVAAIGARGEEILRLLGVAAAPGKADLVFVGAEELGDLATIRKAMKRISERGGVWIIFPKGQKHIRENDVIAGGRAAGLKDIKVVSFSPTHTGLKFVAPVAARAKS
jgi:hypothetical protein